MRIAKTRSEQILSSITAMSSRQVEIRDGLMAARRRPSSTRSQITRQALLNVATQRSGPEFGVLGPCGICGEPVFRQFKHPHSFSASIDHRIPQARGGTDAPSNLQLAHLGCNSAKRDSLPGESPAARALRRRISTR